MAKNPDDSPKYQRLGRFIRKLRKESGLTQSELADTMSVSQPMVSDWEAGWHRPSWPNLRRLSKKFGTTLTSLIDKAA